MPAIRFAYIRSALWKPPHCLPIFAAYLMGNRAEPRDPWGIYAHTSNVNTKFIYFHLVARVNLCQSERSSFSFHSLATTSENYTIKCKINSQFLLAMDIYTSSWTTTAIETTRKCRTPRWPTGHLESPTNLVNLPGSTRHPHPTKTFVGGVTDWLADIQTLQSKTEAVRLWIIYEKSPGPVRCKSGISIWRERLTNRRKEIT